MVVAISLLGPFRVEVDDVPVTSPWTRRDAASLVKVLALRHGRQLHREQVIELLWPGLEVAEAAPRLHKAAHFARKAMGSADAVVLRGEMVSLLPGVSVVVDVDAFGAAAETALADGSPAAASAVLDRYTGEPLESDLYLDWAEETRERVGRLRHRLMRQAGRWSEIVEIDPLDEEAQLHVMRELVHAGDRPGALRQFERLDAALRREVGVGAGPEARRLRDQLLSAHEQIEGPPTRRQAPEPEIRFCRTRDGVTLAYAFSGVGPPLVKAANWMTHVDHDWNSTVWRHWLVQLSRRRRLVRYDERGCGLSDRDIEPPTFSSWVEDLETVVDAAGLDRFPLLGISQGGAVAVAYAARHPERVSKLVLYGAYAQGRIARAPGDRALREHQLQVDLVRLGWGSDEPAFRQVFTSQFMPDASRALWDEFNDLQRSTTSADNAAMVLELTGPIDVTEEARQVRAPTLVLHARHDHRPPFEQGRLLASLIPDSRFVALESNNHILLADEPAWPVFLAEVEAFLAP